MPAQAQADTRAFIVSIPLCLLPVSDQGAGFSLPVCGAYSKAGAGDSENLKLAALYPRSYFCVGMVRFAGEFGMTPRARSSSLQRGVPAGQESSTVCWLDSSLYQ